MKLRNSLFKQGLKLILIPIVLQAIFLCWFALLYTDAANAMRYQNTRLLASTACSKVGVLSMELVANLFLAIHISREKKSDTISLGVGIISIEKEKEFKLAIEDLVETGRDDDEIYSRTIAVKEAIQKFKEEIARECLDPETTFMLDTVRSIYKRMTPLRMLLHKTVEELNDMQSAKSLDYFTKSNTAEIVILLLVLIGIAANILVAYSLWMISRRKVLSNLNTIEENFHRLAENKELLPLIDNEDEFSAFNENFREIAEEVLATRLERQKYLEVMNEILREPLLELNTFIDRFKDGGEMPMTPRAEAAIARTSTTNKRLIMMLNELIDFEQIERGIFSINVDDASAKSIIDSAIDCTGPPSGKKLEIVSNLKKDITFRADADRLTQVLINLLSNAVKFSPSNSTITLSAVEEEEEDTVIFSVQDQGRGIPEEMLDKIFERYEQVDQIADSKSQKGSGLGLSICKSIIEAHGGSIWADNAETGGAIMSFSVPKDGEPDN